MNRRLELPTLSDRISNPKLEEFEPWAIWDFRRLGALEPGLAIEVEGQDSLGRTFGKIESLPDALLVTIGGHVQRLGITHTACGRGGLRPWWLCPVCGSRRGVVFLRARKWGCRGCMGLPYRSQRMSRLSRATAKAKRLHALLGGTGNLAQELPITKPPGMRRRTYLAKRAQLSVTLKLVHELLRLSMERLYGSAGPPRGEMPWLLPPSARST